MRHYTGSIQLSEDDFSGIKVRRALRNNLVVCLLLSGESVSGEVPIGSYPTENLRANSSPTTSKRISCAVDKMWSLR
jgi:hypothetical protein